MANNFGYLPMLLVHLSGQSVSGIALQLASWGWRHILPRVRTRDVGSFGSIKSPKAFWPADGTGYDNER